jgi:hypothetical protein
MWSGTPIFLIEEMISGEGQGNVHGSLFGRHQNQERKQKKLQLEEVCQKMKRGKKLKAQIVKWDKKETSAQ